MQEKTPEKNIQKTGKPVPAGNFRFYVLQELLLSTSPVTILQLRKTLQGQRRYFNQDSIRTALHEIAQIMPAYGLTKTTVRAGRSRAAAFFISNKNLCPVSEKS